MFLVPKEGDSTCQGNIHTYMLIFNKNIQIKYSVLFKIT